MTAHEGEVTRMTATPEDLRSTLREIIASVLQDGLPSSSASDDGTVMVSSQPAPRDLAARPPIRQLTVSMIGSPRAISTLEQALKDGDALIQVTVSVPWGPSVRVKIAPHDGRVS